MSAPAIHDRYRWAAPIYDFATLAWSGGAIWRTRAHALRFAEPGKTVLVPGAGTGRLALEAAKRGAQTLALERSPAMHARAKRRIERYLLRAAAESRPGDSAGRGPLDLDLRLTSFEELGETMSFDVVVAEHFLNVFTSEAMPAVRERLIALTRPGGVLVIADFSPVDPKGSRLIRAAQRLHHVVPLGGCALLTKNAMHPVFDHGLDLEGRSDLRLESSVGQQSFLIGPRWFRTWTFRKL